MHAVVNRLFADLLTRFAEASARGSTPTETIDGLFQAWLDFIAERPAFAPLVLRGMIDGQGPVRELLEGQMAPLLDQIEVNIRRAGAAPRTISVRAALLQIGSDTLVRVSSGSLARPLWGDDDPMLTVRQLFDLSRV